MESLLLQMLINPNADIIIEKGSLVNGLYSRILHNLYDGSDGFFVVQMILLDQNAAWIDSGGQPPHLVASVANRLLRRRDFRGQISGITLIPQPQMTLGSGQKSRFGE